MFIILLVITSSISLFIGYNLGYNTNKVVTNENDENLKTIESYSEINNVPKGQPVEITIDNWQNYIELEDNEETSIDDFGDIIGTYKYTIFKFKENVIKNVDVRLKLRYDSEVSLREEQIVKIYDGSDQFKTNYQLDIKNKNGFDSKDYDCRATIDDFKVINAKGTVYIR